MATVKTAKVKRRTLRLESLDELLAEAERIVRAEQTGNLKRRGNWTTGQIFSHVAAWIDYAYDGYPIGPPPFIVRLILKMRRKRYLRDGLPAGVYIPKVENGTTGMDLVPTAEGAERIRRAVQRLRTEPPRHPSPAFGMMSHEDSICAALRHAELHFSFLEYQ